MSVAALESSQDHRAWGGLFRVLYSKIQKYYKKVRVEDGEEAIAMGGYTRGLTRHFINLTSCSPSKSSFPAAVFKAGHEVFCPMSRAE